MLITLRDVKPSQKKKRLQKDKQKNKAPETLHISTKNLPQKHPTIKLVQQHDKNQTSQNILYIYYNIYIHKYKSFTTSTMFT